MADDLASVIGAPELAAPAPQPAPVSAAPAAGDAAVWTLLGEAGTNPQGQLAVGSTIYNRQRASGAGSFADVASDPANGYEAWQNAGARAKTQARYPVGSPEYNAAAGVLSDLQSGKTKALPYDSFYSPTGQAALGRKPPSFEDGSGVDIGGNRFFSGKYVAPNSSELANAIGLTPAEQAQLAAHTGAAPTTPAGQTPGTGKEFNTGPNFSHMSAAAEATFHNLANDPNRGIDPNASPGSPKLPYYVQPGTTVPVTPGLRWVDADGKEHVNPGGALERLGGALAGLGQGLGPDTAASALRLGAGPQSSEDLATSGNAALNGSDIAPSPFTSQQLQAGARNALGAETQAYNIRHMGDAYAQAGRFTGQAVPATLAASAVPEIEVPAALSGVPLAGAGARLATNALRGTAAAATNVGANPNVPVSQQLAAGAAGGVVIPPVFEHGASVGAKALGIGSTKVAPEILNLADKAVNTYGIPLRGSQIAGTADPAIAIKDSNLLTAPGAGFASNQAAQRTAFTRAVAGTFGADSDKITPPVMSQARRDLGQKFDDFAASHSVPDTTALGATLDRTLNDAGMVLPGSELSPLEKQVAGIKDLAAKNGNTLPGDVYQSLVRTGSPLDRAMQSHDSNIRFYAGQIHDALSDAIASTATPEELADFANTRLQYKNLMTVKGLAAKAGITGEISPVQLAGVVNRSFDDRAFSGAGPLGELADIGQVFMKQPPNSNTAQRAAEIASRNWFPATLAGAAGGEMALHGPAGALIHDPGLAIQLGLSAGLAKGAGYATNALAGLRNGPVGASVILGRAESPGAVTNALNGVKRAAKPVEIPLSALAGVRLGNLGAPAAANAQ